MERLSRVQFVLIIIEKGYFSHFEKYPHLYFVQSSITSFVDLVDNGQIKLIKESLKQ
jgi:hypothetical protein